MNNIRSAEGKRTNTSVQKFEVDDESDDDISSAKENKYFGTNDSKPDDGAIEPQHAATGQRQGWVTPDAKKKSIPSSSRVLGDVIELEECDTP
eukprot:CAMPEP_0185028664 /NCGR_PEP_ID=MMETSP1103-20130426/14565_1 /TAXON_ID=36769 /ORGANISM="Paraphysomonas bandaiensis, Strain Caron Lab Isolate" /LENGTH=92 /DNA_ID=CAMNT_0027563157 /DNA_START=140 /DNA_END=418 /DNA_ORIENTATION=+